MTGASLFKVLVGQIDRYIIGRGLKAVLSVSLVWVGGPGEADAVYILYECCYL